MFEKTFRCVSCNSKVNITASEKQWKRYQNGKEIIQDIFPELTANEREIMITGLCGKCFDKLFKE